jgi:hypothetical protein
MTAHVPRDRVRVADARRLLFTRGLESERRGLWLLAFSPQRGPAPVGALLVQRDGTIDRVMLEFLLNLHGEQTNV